MLSFQKQTKKKKKIGQKMHGLRNLVKLTITHPGSLHFMWDCLFYISRLPQLYRTLPPSTHLCGSSSSPNSQVAAAHVPVTACTCPDVTDMFAHAQMRAATAGSHGDPAAVPAVESVQQ